MYYNRLYYNLKIKFLAILIIVFLSIPTVSLADNKIKDIVISGNKIYSINTYKDWVGFSVGDNFKYNYLNNVVKNLYASNFIDNVKVNFKNNILFIDIKEKKIIKKILLVGNKKLKNDIIEEKLKLKVKGFFSQQALDEDLYFIKSFYNSIGLMNTTVKYELNTTDDNSIEVIFKIKESKKARIGNIYFIGNNIFTNKQLKEELYSKENKFYRFGRKINYNSDFFEYDSYLLRMFYLSKGFLDFEINSVVGVFNKKSGNFDIIFDVNEGEKYTISEIGVINNISNIENKTIYEIENNIVNIEKGEFFNINKVNSNINLITDYLQKKNLKFFNVNMQVIPNKEYNNVKVNFVIDNTEKYYIGKIKIKNNIRTADFVIRNELAIQEGDPYNEQFIERSRQKIMNLGYFKDVNCNIIESDIKNQYDLIITVEEQSTGSLNFGIGYNSSYGINGNISIDQKNLFGIGNKINFGININKYNNNISLNYIRPNIFGTDITNGISLFYQDSDNVSNSNSGLGYNKTERGVRTFLAFDITEYLSQTISYSYFYDKIDKVMKNYNGILTNKHDYVSEVSIDFSYDKRDNYYYTTNGYILSYNISFAGLFGTKDYLKHILYGAFYYPLYLNKVIFKVESKLGYIHSINSNPLFPDDGFYLGGYNMRGFESGGIGPRAKITTINNTTSDYGLAGTKLLYFNTEIKFPLFLPKEFSIFGVLFYNAGCVYGIENNPKIDKTLIYDSNSIRSAAGFSILWQTPMGNISLDFSKTIKKETYDQDENFRFNIGTNF